MPATPKATGLIKHPRGKWLYASSPESEEWSGGFKTLEEAIDDAIETVRINGFDEETTLWFAHGKPLTKSECEEVGQEWPYYAIDPNTSLRISLPKSTK